MMEVKAYTYADIEAANEKTKGTEIKGKIYIEVNQRIKAFRMVCPHGAIITEMISNEDGVCVFRATIYDEEKNIIGTGTAFEKETSSFINKTSYIENCETSAVGRALGMCGFGIDTSVASYEEVQNAINNQNAPQAEADYRKMLIAELKRRGIDTNTYAAEHNMSKDTTPQQFKALYEELIATKEV